MFMHTRVQVDRPANRALDVHSDQTQGESWARQFLLGAAQDTRDAGLVAGEVPVHLLGAAEGGLEQPPNLGVQGL